VAEQFLNAPEIESRVQQMRGEAVPQSMRMHGEPQGVKGILLDYSPDVTIGERPPVTVDEQGVAYSFCGLGRGEISAEGRRRGSADRRESLTSSLTEDAHVSPAKVDVAGSQTDEFAHAQAAGVEEFENGPVAQLEGGTELVRRGEEFFDLLDGQDARQFTAATRAAKAGRRIVVPAAGQEQPPIESAQRGESSRDAGARPALPQESGEVESEVGGGRLFGRPGGVACESGQVRPIRPDALGREPPLVGEMFQEGVDGVQGVQRETSSMASIIVRRQSPPG